VPTDKAGGDCTTEVVDIGLRRGSIMQRVTNAEHKALDEGIAVANPGQQFNLRGIAWQEAL